MNQSKSSRNLQQCVVVSRMLELACEKAAKRSREREQTTTVFDAKGVVPISMAEYLSRWLKHTKCSGSVLAAAMVLLDRVLAKAGLTLTTRNMHRLFFSSLVITHKMCFDTTHSNTFYSKIGGVGIEEVSRLEREFLRLLDWQCFVAPEEYAEYEAFLA
eukprot:TRINITY_DN34220_c0_g1_i1.p1 TRINITY_DN34220_c0_g1~~TRINITY_DN34220_c0_g1_i1.p1  ORF type:complete len:175 (+),score=34.74 TRINITY_DN34220_c0_g1_i1:51-527(+)